MSTATELVNSIEKLEKSLEESLPQLSYQERKNLEEKLTTALVQKCQCSTYFNPEKLEHEKDKYPSNAIDLVKNETIKIVEVLDDKEADLCYEEGSATKNQGSC